MLDYLLIPGLGDSMKGHWQNYFEHKLDNCRRVIQKHWNAPVMGDWVERIDDYIADCPSGNVVLIGHSLGCCAILHWANRYHRKIKGALLVSPSDVDLFEGTLPLPSRGFSPMPLIKLPFKTVVVASQNDPWVSLERAAYFSDSWGAQLVNIGNAGHINIDSGYGKWDAGLEIVRNAF